MKRKIFFIISFFALGILHAQETVTQKDTAKKDTAKHIRKPVPSTGYASITAGYGYPIGNFAKLGCAEKGNNTGISFALPIKNTSHGVAVQFNYGSNPVN